MNTRRLEPRWIVGWLVSVFFALLVGFWASWTYWRQQWHLAPLPAAPPAGPCALVGSSADASPVWASLLAYSPGDDARTQEVRLTRDGALARLEVIRDGVFDDEVSATRETYWLSWSAPAGWAVTSCSSSVLR